MRRMNRVGNLFRRAGPAVFCLACTVWYLVKNVWRVIPMLKNGSDLEPYREAARQILAGRTPFTAHGYIYPALLAFLMTPLAPFEYGVARWTWFGLSHGCLIGAAWVMWRALGRDWTAACIIGLVWACGDAAFEDLYIGQIGP